MFTYETGPYNARLDISDLFFGLLFIIAVIAFSVSRKEKELKAGNTHFKYYALNVYFKLLFATLFAAIYIFYYGGADSAAYWRGAEKLNNLFWESPRSYLTELMTEPKEENIILRFNAKTGYPPIWIYIDQGSYFVSKVLSILMIFFGQSYYFLTLIISYILARVSWNIFELVRYYKITSDRFAALSILFIPSVSFWCAGISKDSLVLISVFFILYYLFGLANKTVKRRWASILAIIVFGWILVSTRSFMLFTVAGPVLIAISTRMLKAYKDSILLKNIMLFFIVVISFGGFLFFLRYEGERLAVMTSKYLDEAKVQQLDFSTNESYGENKYDLGINDYSPIGMLRIAPAAILTAFYRPGIWESRSPLLFLSGLETTLFILLTVQFLFRGKLLPKIRRIRENEFLVFGILFALILAFFAGFTSGLFGVLVRFKAPLLPFLLIVLSTKTIKETEPTEMEEKTEEKEPKVLA